MIDAKIIVKNKKSGMYEIKTLLELKEVYLDYDALSYNLENQEYEFKPIISWMDRKTKAVYKVLLNNGNNFTCTPNHKFWCWDGQKQKDKKIIIREVKDIDLTRWWKRHIFVARKIPSLNINLRITNEQFWIEGNYVAEGWVSKAKSWKNKFQVSIAGDNLEIKKILIDNLETLNIPYLKSKRKRHSYVTINKSLLKYRLAKEFGKKALNKHFPNEYLSLSRKQLNILLDGYALGDAYFKFGKKYNEYLIYNTISDKLALQLKFLHFILGRPLSSYYQINHQGLGKNPIWRLTENTNSCFNRETLKDMSKVGIKRVEFIGKNNVYNIRVADNHNFILAESGVLSHT